MKHIGWLLCAAILIAGCERTDATIRVAMPPLPPYFHEQRQAGLHFDRIQTLLRLQGRDIQPVFVPFSQLSDALNLGTVDVAALVPPDATDIPAVSETRLTYQNVILTRENGPAPNNVESLKALRVIAFQGASQLLGEAFESMAAANPHYRELREQSEQAMLLVLGRVDAVIGDERILRYYADEAARRMGVAPQLVATHAFEPVRYRVGFRDPDLAAAFDRAAYHLDQAPSP
ncbi:transporter substrate-binding domain-containing protein [uncultured Abyssibacter sp.]|uniref:substrate-binding periplasmic protein n=1 Tax=uncultured Abyssibacter sp. TaxID=2320202 RepID=UPI0032B2A9A1